MSLSRHIGHLTLRLNSRMENDPFSVLPVLRDGLLLVLVASQRDSAVDQTLRDKFIRTTVVFVIPLSIVN